VNPFARTFNAVGGRLMARTGRIGILGTTGARTGRARRAPIGFVARPDGTLLIGSGSKVNRGWTANLKANPAATFSVKGVERSYRARLVPPEERDAALAELKATMGGMADRADWGDLFVLEPEARP
jgi:deazaflavin-dependent oxidoreductase (nitroreductase family)